MPTREERKADAARHIALVKGVLANETEASIESATIYEDGEGRELEIPEPSFESTFTSVTTDFATAAVRHAKGKIVVIDHVSFIRPGGAYEDGAFGPEQILCAGSNLYPILQGKKKDYHDANRGYQRGQLFTDRALYIPDVAFTSEGGIAHADVLAIAEPNRERALDNHRSERERDNTLAERIEALLRIAASNGCETLIVGAFGCGRGMGGEERTISLFQSWIDEHPGVIGHIVFAVPRSRFGAFDAAFGGAVEAARQASEEAAAQAEEDDYEDFRDIDLPEGITLR